jgi:hypothetical protein
MKPFPALPSFCLALTLLCANAHASSDPSRSANQRRSTDVAAELKQSTPRALTSVDSPAARHVFPVMDEKGLLLTCIAPEMETNKDSDNFKNCVLAPGRTLDDVMHSFIGAARQQQIELEKAQAAARMHADDKAETGAVKK